MITASLRIAVLALVMVAPAHAAEFTPAPNCGADLFGVDASFEETQARLNKVKKEDHVELCAAVKHHIEVMANGINVYQRCLAPGHDKSENIAQLVASIDDFLYINENQGCARFELPKIDLPKQ